MGLFNKKKEEDEVKEEVSKEVEASSTTPKEIKKPAKKTVALKKVAGQEGDGQLAYKFIVKPWITEKTQELMGNNKYVFKLRAKTTKREAKVAVEKLYGVSVLGVNLINIPQKKRRFGKFVGKKSAIRKAIVTLKKGDKIEIFE